MAIQFARVERIGRSGGKNACCKSAYNAREVIRDQESNVTYSFKQRGGNAYHEILLPSHANAHFKDSKIFANAVEAAEKRKDAQLFKEYVLALPDEQSVSMELKVEMVKAFIEANRFIEEGLGVQMDIHEPHDGDKNWHAHLLVTTRRFKEDGMTFGPKARDLEPRVRGGVKAYINGKEETNLGDLWKGIQNSLFEKYDMPNRVDELQPVAQVHLGPHRMRDVINETVIEHEMRRDANQVAFSSGEDLLNHITKRASVFTREDMMRSMKFLEDKSLKERLLSEALASHSLIRLHAKGEETNLFTTKHVRGEEERTLRYAERVSSKNYWRGGHKIVSQKVNEGTVSFAQGHVLKGLLKPDGIKILEGRAGTGKSYVLGQYLDIRLQEKNRNDPIIGLAPTHKAVGELKAQGYKDTATVKGFLFEVETGKREVAPYSTILVDEAGMVGTETYQELLKIAAHSRAEVILVGDSKQLQSVERGGMFTYLSQKYGALDLSEVRRQKKDWGKDVSLAFAKGATQEGINILKSKDRFHYEASASEAYSNLIEDWSKSKFPLYERQVLAVSNKQVDILNRGIRAWMRANDQFSREREIINENGRNTYGFYDRIVMTQTDKEKGVRNGDFGTITYLSEEHMEVKFDNGEVKVLDPREAQFKHGYASTVYKAQGASIKDVYVYHGGFCSRQNAYVEMSRHVEDVHLYAHREASKTEGQVIEQMSRDVDRGASINYEAPQVQKGLFGKIGMWFEGKAQAVGDRIYSNPDYYVFEGKERTLNKVSDVLSQEELKQRGAVKEISASEEISQEEVLSDIANISEEKVVPIMREHASYQDRIENIRHDLRMNASQIAPHLMKESPNPSLSTQRTYRFGEKGAIAVEVAGPKAGIWHDFRDGSGGDLIALIQRQEGMDFKEALEYAAKECAVQSSMPFYEKREKDRDLRQEEAARERVERIVSKSEKIDSKNPEHAPVIKYLSEERGILNVHELDDVKVIPSYRPHDGEKKISSLVGIVRDGEGKEQGAQTILIDESGKKADVPVPKRSHGILRGGAVTLQDSRLGVTVLTEGIETGLSIKEAHVPASIKAVLGIHNFKNYEPAKDEVIIIAGDRDRNHERSSKTLDMAVTSLLEKGAKEVYIVQPEKEGDFNDVLRERGQKAVRESFKGSFSSLFAQAEITTEHKEHFIKEYEPLLKEHGFFYPKTSLDTLMKDSMYWMGKGEVEEYLKDTLAKALHTSLKTIDEKYAAQKAQAESFKEYIKIAGQEQKEIVPLLDNQRHSRIALSRRRDNENMLYFKEKDFMEHGDVRKEGERLLRACESLSVRDDALLLRDVKNVNLGYILKDTNDTCRRACVSKTETGLKEIKETGHYQEGETLYTSTISYLEAVLSNPDTAQYLEFSYKPVLEEEKKASQALEILNARQISAEIEKNYLYLQQNFRKLMLKGKRDPEYLKEHGIKGPDGKYYDHHDTYLSALFKDKGTLDQMDKSHPIFKEMEKADEKEQRAAQLQLQRQRSRGYER